MHNIYIMHYNFKLKFQQTVINLLSIFKKYLTQLLTNCYQSDANNLGLNQF